MTGQDRLLPLGLLEAFVRNPVKVIVGALLLALFGTIALIEMPMQLTPEVQTPTITIETNWRGASPQEVEREIIQEQEEQLKGIPGLRKLSAECLDSQGKLILEFLVGTDMGIRVSYVDEIPLGRTGKRQGVISTLESTWESRGQLT